MSPTQAWCCAPASLTYARVPASWPWNAANSSGWLSPLRSTRSWAGHTCRNQRLVRARVSSSTRRRYSVTAFGRGTSCSPGNRAKHNVANEYGGLLVAIAYPQYMALAIFLEICGPAHRRNDARSPIQADPGSRKGRRDWSLVSRDLVEVGERGVCVGGLTRPRRQPRHTGSAILVDPGVSR